VGGAVTGAIGFAAAYLLAQRQRRWDAEDAAMKVRAALIQSVRIPLEIIRDEIRNQWGLYYTGDVEDQMTRALREAIYELGDEDLIRTLERAVLPLRKLAGGTDRKSSGMECAPLIETMLKRLGELDAETRKAVQARWAQSKAKKTSA